MRLLHGTRMSGKTTRLVGWLRDRPDRVLVVENMGMVDNLRHAYPDLQAHQFATYWQVRDGHQLRGRNIQIAIDNAEVFIQALFSPHEVEVVAMTATDVECLGVVA